ncbi:MAG: pentapeptide repeat-containing protein [Nostoc sp. NMS7]|uniref:pentapeptide repeat-containing protein n=1 Tax=Nostoc sp. NMS7 TaxID=2815391 RepID=UPI0025EA7D66|nr:pentapeptide repeat-containing protein [Nostoc sp. NMS7]MBN3949930.1 pentapeptide repeat-containing protein [Nostoc sp. NMS7]
MIKNFLFTKRKLLIGVAVVAGVIAIYSVLYRFEWSGFGPDSNKSVSTEEAINPKDGKIIKLKKETENFQSAKTLWDWLQLFGVIAIPLALFYFERREQRRSDQRAQEEKTQVEEQAKREKANQEEQAKREKEIADNNLHEQALEAYIDRMSELLIDKELKVLIDKKLKESDSEYQKLDAALDIVRARTLSVLRRLDQDGERKGSVIRFLVDAELINNLDLNGRTLDLNGANLIGANLLGGDNLSSANLWRANLSRANLWRAYLSRANLSSANLEGAILEGAILEGAYLSSANLSGAILEGAYLIDANLSSANLEGANLSSANLEGANLSSANLEGAYLIDANLSSTNLEVAKKLTPEQVKSASNWELSKYNKEFRAKLGLLPEPDE